MKRAISVVLALGLLAGAFALPAEAAKKKKKKVVRVERVVELPYQCPCGPSTPVASQGFWLAGGTFGGGPVATGGEENFVKVEVTDQSGQTVYVGLGQDTDGDGFSDGFGDVCGSTEEPLAVPAPGSEVSAFVYVGTCPDGTPSIATSGTVKLTFSNIP